MRIPKRYNKHTDMKYLNKIFQNKFLKLTGIIILATLSFFMGKYLHGRDHDSVIEQFPYIDFSRNFIDQEHYITNLQPLREDLNKMTDEFGRDKISIYIEYLNTGANISINQDNYIWPASLLKVPLGMTVMKKVEDGEWKLTDKLVLMSGDIDPRSGDPNSKIYNSPIGTRFTIEELLFELLRNSDNSAYDVLIRNTSDADVQKLVSAIGLDKLNAQDSGKISAKEYSRLLRSLYTASFLDRAHSQKILEFLDDSDFDSYLAGVIDPSISFPHKYGKNVKSNVYADSGIVYIPNRPYIISVMIQGDTSKLSQDEEKKAIGFMQEVSKKTYEYFLNYNLE